MAQNYTINGTVYSFPDVDEQEWGQDVTDWANAVTNGMLQKAGGSFTLTADVNFGANYGVLSVYYKSRAASPAASGILRLGNTEKVAWRNAGDSADITLSIDGSDEWSFNGTALTTAELGYVAGVTSAIQTQLDAMVEKAGDTMTGALVISLATGNSLVVDTNVLVVDATNNRVGIGTVSPLACLSVTDSSGGNSEGDGQRVCAFFGANEASTTARGTITIQSNDAMAVDMGGSIAFGGRYLTGADNGATFAQIKAGKENATTNNVSGYLAFSTRDNVTGIAERMRIDPLGYVGIGVTDPSEMLDVNGNIEAISFICVAQASAPSNPLSLPMIYYNSTDGQYYGYKPGFGTWDVIG